MKTCSVFGAFMVLFTEHAYATTSSQILVMSNQLYQIARDLTTGLFPTSVLLIAIGQSGKTTLCNAILDCIATTHPQDRVMIIEDTVELKCNVKDSVSLRTSCAKTMNDLIYDSMRMRPDRIVIGEVRGKEAHALIKAWNTGHTGGVSTIHANSAQSGILRLEQLVLEAGVVPAPEAIIEAINVLIFIEKTNRNQKGRQVASILNLTGHDKKQGYLTEVIGG